MSLMTRDITKALLIYIQYQNIILSPFITSETPHIFVAQYLSKYFHFSQVSLLVYVIWRNEFRWWNDASSGLDINWLDGCNSDTATTIDVNCKWCLFKENINFKTSIETLFLQRCRVIWNRCFKYYFAVSLVLKIIPCKKYVVGWFV